jgi:hypothetical protein
MLGRRRRSSLLKVMGVGEKVALTYKQKNREKEKHEDK